MMYDGVMKLYDDEILCVMWWSEQNDQKKGLFGDPKKTPKNRPSAQEWVRGALTVMRSTQSAIDCATLACEMLTTRKKKRFSTTWEFSRRVPQVRGVHEPDAEHTSRQVPVHTRGTHESRRVWTKWARVGIKKFRRNFMMRSFMTSHMTSNTSRECSPQNHTQCRDVLCNNIMNRSRRDRSQVRTQLQEKKILWRRWWRRSRGATQHTTQSTHASDKITHTAGSNERSDTARSASHAL